MREIEEHSLIRRVIEAGRGYRAREMNAEDLQKIVSATMSALESDIPLSVRDEMARLDAAIDSARFATDDPDRGTVIAAALDRFEDTVRGSSN